MLDFNLTALGISINGGTRSQEELAKFIDKLTDLLPFLPRIWTEEESAVGVSDAPKVQS